MISFTMRMGMTAFAAEPIPPFFVGPINDLVLREDQAMTAVSVSSLWTGRGNVFTSPNLPPGMVISAAGVVSGTPTTQRAPTISTIVATNPHGSASGPVTITVGTPPSFTVAPSVTPASGAIGAVFTVAYTAAGFPAPTVTYQWELAGVDIPGANAISYTSTAAGALTVRVTLSNSLNVSGVVVETAPVSIVGNVTSVTFGTDQFTVQTIATASALTFTPGPALVTVTGSRTPAPCWYRLASAAAGAPYLYATGNATGAGYNVTGLLPLTQYRFDDGTGAAATLVTTTTDDVTAPILSDATDAASGATGAVGSVRTNEADGTLYWVVLLTADATPSAVQVENGQKATGAAAEADDSQAVTVTGVQAISPNVSGLTAATGYKIAFMHRDAAGNRSAVIVADGFTTSGGTAVPNIAFAYSNGDNLLTATFLTISVTQVTGNLMVFVANADSNLDDIDVAAITAPNGETVNAAVSNYTGTGQTLSLFWWIATANATGVVTIPLVATQAENMTGAGFRLAAGQFNTTTPIGSTITATATTNTAHTTPAWTAGPVANQRVCLAISSQFDPVTTYPTGWTLPTNGAIDPGGAPISLIYRDAGAGAGAAIAADAFVIAADSPVTMIGFTINPA